MKPKAQPRRGTTVDLILGSICAVLLVLMVLLVVADDANVALYELALSPFEILASEEVRVARQVRRETSAVVDGWHHQNEVALQRAMVELGQCFNRYEAGVAAFAEEMTTWGERLKLLQLQARQWAGSLWSGEKSREVAEYVQAAFERHVFSDARLQRDVHGVLEALLFDLEANQNRMVAELRGVILQAGLPVDTSRLTLAHYQQHAPAFQRAVFMRVGQQSLLRLTETLAVDAGVSYLACRYIPVPYKPGCLVIALVAGIAVDWYQTDQLQKEIILAGQNIVNATRRSVMYDVHHGLQPRLQENLNAIRAANQQTTRNLLKGRS